MYWWYAFLLRIPMKASRTWDRVRSNAAESFGSLGDRRAVGVLCALLSERGYSDNVAAKAAEALGKLGDPETVEPLCATLLQEQCPTLLREESLRAVRALDITRAVDCLCRALSSPDVEAREQAARCLGDLRDPRCFDRLLASLGDPHPDVRVAAILAVMRVDAQRGVSAAASLLGAKDERTRIAAIRALACLGGSAGREALGVPSSCTAHGEVLVFVATALRGPASMEVRISDLDGFYYGLAEALKATGMSSGEVVGAINDELVGECPRCHASVSGDSIGMVVAVRSSGLGEKVLWLGGAGASGRLGAGLCPTPGCDCPYMRISIASGRIAGLFARRSHQHGQT